MYCFSSQKVPAAQSVSDRGEMVSRLNWERKSDCKGMRGDSAYQKKKEKLAQQRLEARAGEDHLAQGEGCSDQVGRLEAKGVLQQGVKGQEDPSEGGDLLGLKEGLDNASWVLDFDSDSMNDEIYWGCFYFFPCFRMCRRDKRGQP